jgi:hypothetical protein
VGTIFEVRGELLPTSGASPGGFGVKEIGLRSPLFVKYPTAAIAFQKRLSALDGDQGNEEEADIVVQPFAPGRRQAAARARPRLVINLNFLRLHSANEDEGAPL